ncbi:MAG: NAD-dependent malic enzyme [Gammaproteobacteria bacterium]
MKNFKYVTDKDNNIVAVNTNLRGVNVLSNPRINKSSAFTEQERIELGLLGKLPLRVETLEEQVERLYMQYQKKNTNLQKNIYLNTIHDTNQTLFYQLVSKHLLEMLPIIYTPTVGEAVEEFSHEFRRPRGLYLSYPERDRLSEILANFSGFDIDLIVMTDGEGVLGIGDQGVGGMDIPIAKLMLYVICGGINPNRVLPIQLDVGTNNKALLDDPMYLGWRHERLSGEKYDEFIGEVVHALTNTFKTAFLHWEDFGRDNARRNLLRYKDKICTFNDDMQGTGVVTLAAIISAVRAVKANLTDQDVVIFGAGTAGVGIADQISDAMVRLGLSKEETYKKFYLIDRQGLLTENCNGIMPFQKPYLRTNQDIENWNLKDSNNITLYDVVKNAKPTILIGCSTQKGAFTEEIIRMMCSYTERPMIFPLSNPTEKAEATPKDLYQWTNGNALIATGSPFDDVLWQNQSKRIAQSNNAFVFPGIGLGVICSHSRLLTDDMLWAACSALVEESPAKHDPAAPLLPSLLDARNVSIKIAIAVAEQARKDGLAQVSTEVDFSKTIPAFCWEPQYYSYHYDPNLD